MFIVNISLNAGVAPSDWLIVNISLNTGVVQSGGLIGNISLIFKKGDRSTPSKYRLVSFTSISCKMLEHILYDHYNILADKRHGFHKHHSDLSQSLDNWTQIDMVVNMWTSRRPSIRYFTDGYFIKSTTLAVHLIGFQISSLK